MSKYKIIALIGAAGSGKDTILKNVLKEDSSIHEIVSCTTRPPREGEINGKNQNDFDRYITFQKMLYVLSFLLCYFICSVFSFYYSGFVVFVGSFSAVLQRVKTTGSL